MSDERTPKRPFRSLESHQSEDETREMLKEFLEVRGFTKVKSQIVLHGQTIEAISPMGERLVMRVRLCWRRETEGRDAERVRTYSAAQLLAKIENDDWEGSLERKIAREKKRGVSHLLLVQRDGEDIKYAALLPLSTDVPIWTEQVEISDRLIRNGDLGHRKKNHAKNCSSPTIWLQDDRGAKEVADALWKYDGVIDIAELPLLTLIRLGDTTGESTNADTFVPLVGDRRRVVQQQIAVRRGQQKFRDELRIRFNGRCVITGCEVLAVLEAAHISPYRGDGDNDPQNGLLLRADVHTLFDLDLLGIHPNTLQIELHNKLKSDPLYGALQGKTVNCEPTTRPSLKALRVRYNEFLAGLNRDEA